MVRHHLSGCLHSILLQGDALLRLVLGFNPQVWVSRHGRQGLFGDRYLTIDVMGDKHTREVGIVLLRKATTQQCGI
jgi:hypothetical protein